MLDRLHRTLHRLSRWGVWLSGSAILLSTFLILAEIVLRNFNASIYVGAGEVAGYVFAIAVAWGFSYCLFERAHVRIDVGYRFLGPRWRLALDFVSLVVLLAFAIVLAERAWTTMAESRLFGSVSITPLQTPLWLPQLLWACGFVFFAANIAFLIVRILVLALSARLDEAARIYPATAESEGLAAFGTRAEERG